MLGKKLFMPFILGSALCMTVPAMAQNGPQKAIDPEALAKALQNYPDLKGRLTPQALVEAMKNCPGLNGTQANTRCPALNGKIDPAVLAVAAQNCPALNGSLPPDAAKCPALNGQPGKMQNSGALPGGGFIGPRGGSEAAIDKKIDKRMNRIVRALERNKRSADTLIQVARDAGADPNAISDMEKMAAAFRQIFMSTVSPQQIVESILAAPAAPEQPQSQGIIITGPDGSTWLVMPDQQNVQGAPQKQGRPRPAQQGHRGQKPGKPVPPQGMSGPQGMQTPPPPPPGMQGRPLPPQGMQTPPPPPPGMQGAPLPPQGFRVPPQQKPAPAPQQGELIIMEETITPEYMPLWPTKDDLGKDGVLKYLEKRSTVMNAQ